MNPVIFVATSRIPASAEAVFEWHEAPGAFEQLTASWERVRVLRHDCEWKGEAHYWSVIVPGRRVNAAAWRYANPLPGYELIRGYVSFYPSLVECAVDSIAVVAQPGRFYGGWVTPELVGPFKGEPASEGW